ncbi:MAG: nitroreductase [Chloroflexota bacterium]|nr:MAG: nitroreductase [Chloroflexota bacterium]
MDVLEAIGGLRVVRRYQDRPLEAAHLEAILNAGRRASSSKNRQRWDFVVVTERAGLRALSEVGPYAGHVADAAAAIALVFPSPTGEKPHSTSWDLGLAAQNMILAAWSLGIGSCPITVYEPELARRILGYPADHECEQLLTFGYPADPEDLSRPLRGGRRRPLGDVVHRERW